MSVRVLSLVAITGTSLACAIEADLEGKGCDPSGACASGYRCVLELCVRDDGSGMAGGPCRPQEPRCDPDLTCIDDQRCEATSPQPNGDAGVGEDQGVGDDPCGNAGEACCSANACAEGLTCVSGYCSCFAQLVSNEFQTCVVTSDGRVQCAGSNREGQMASGRVGGIQPAPAPIDLPGPVQSLAVGAFHACAVLTDDNVYCWGSNSDGQLGFEPAGPGVFFSTPESVSLDSGVVQLAAGSFHTCARTADHSVWCWGQNEFFQLGTEDVDMSPEPRRVPNLPEGDVLDIATGAYHSCAVVRGSAGTTALCWGSNQFGQLGRGNPPDLGDRTGRPESIRRVQGIVDVETGDWHTCGIQSETSVWCWGRNNLGQLGRGGDPQGTNAFPDLISPREGALTRVYDLATMDDHSCVLGLFDMDEITERLLSCWGSNESGQLGLASSEVPQRTYPARVPDLDLILEVAGGRRHTCATSVRDEVLCFGDNGSGELANNTQTASTSTPTLALFACPNPP